jgi:hypothetical protein
VIIGGGGSWGSLEENWCSHEEKDLGDQWKR